ncbi:Peptidyl-prolyl cis-trans isomerase, FKBP-type [Aphelenchoides besseyi]|nr:Peptidyl-prolyl cis-trans isomerase, FKBP-type [Aphelenchoides besseyi]
MGVDIETISPGDGSTYPRNGQTVSCHYTLTLQNGNRLVEGNENLFVGKKIDSSRDRGKPLDFKLGAGEVIAGWDQGLSLGERAKLTISPDLGYGARGVPGTIPANSVLVRASTTSIELLFQIFDVELVKIK